MCGCTVLTRVRALYICMTGVVVVVWWGRSKRNHGKAEEAVGAKVAPVGAKVAPVSASFGDPVRPLPPSYGIIGGGGQDRGALPAASAHAHAHPGAHPGGGGGTLLQRPALAAPEAVPSLPHESGTNSPNGPFATCVGGGGGGAWWWCVVVVRGGGGGS
jgi:hypothetical protein